jgi:hypothetical protein
MTLSFNGIFVFTALAAVFASTKEATCVMFHRTAYVYIAVGCFLRANPSDMLKYIILLVPVVAAGLLLLDISVFNALNALTCLGVLIYYVLVEFNLVLMSSSSVLLVISLLWLLYDRPEYPEYTLIEERTDPNIVVESNVTKMDHEFQWPTTIRPSDFQWMHLKKH